MMRMIEVKGRRVEGGGRYHLCRRGERKLGEEEGRERERLTTVSNVSGVVIRA